MPATGLWLDVLHLVIGAMVIAPAFEPLVRIPFGLIAGPRILAREGVKSSALGYLMLAAGGIVMALVLRAVDQNAGTDLGKHTWVQFWTSLTPAGTLASVIGAAAGAIVVYGLRSVLTTGVMITMALIPSMAIVGMTLVTADLALARRGLLRWTVDAGLVLMVSGLVLGLKQKFLHRRRSME